ncbi:hypothetical protein Btru_023837 [Bulinus truncatus]|nr:hypothetical protein Btru_023837 [Bulinus truncatus]
MLFLVIVLHSNCDVSLHRISGFLMKCFIFHAVYNWTASAGAPQLCYENRHHDNITAVVGDNGNLLVCIFSHCLNRDCLKVLTYQQTQLPSQHDQYSNVQKGEDRQTGRLGYSWRVNETTPQQHWLRLEIYNITQEDYGVWNVVISSDGKRNLSFSVLVLHPNDKQDINFKYRSIRASNELSVILTCIALGFPQSVAIKRHGDSRVMSRKMFNRRNYQAMLSVDYEISPAMCSDMTTYQCVVTTYNGRVSTAETEVPIEKCPLKLCKGQEQKFAVHASLNGDVHVTLCVVAFPRILNALVLNNVSYDINSTDWLEVNNNGSHIFNYITIKRHRVGLKDFKSYTVQIFSLFNDSVTFYFDLIKTERNTSKEENDDVAFHACRSNKTSLCVLYYSKSRMQLYIKKQYYRRYSLVYTNADGSENKEVQIVFGNNSFLKTEIFVIEIWLINQQHGTVDKHFNGKFWTQLTWASRLHFCSHQDLTLTWTRVDQEDPHRGKHTSSSGVELTRQSSPTDCYKLDVNVKHHKTVDVHLVSMSMSLNYTGRNVTDGSGGLSDIDHTSKFPHSVIIVVMGAVIGASLLFIAVASIVIRRSKDTSTLIQFTSLKTDNVNEQFIVFQCNTSNFPKRLKIIDRCEGVVYVQKYFNPKNYQRVMTGEFYHMILEQKSPLSLECKVHNYQNKPISVFLDWKGDNSTPKICSVSQKIVRVNVNDTARVYIKVLAYPKIVSVNLMRDPKLDTVEKQWTWSSRNLSDVLWYIEIIKDNIQEEDFGNYTVSIQSQVKQLINIDFSVLLKDYILASCDSTDNNTAMYVLIGHTVDLEMCVISQTLINENNIGWNDTPYLRITDKEKFTVNITKDGDHNKIKIKISNITRDDIKFYIVTVKNKILHKRFYIFNLLLKEDSPNFCENNYTVEINHLSQDYCTIVNFCIRSYPVLSRHILINNKLCRINETFDGLSIDSTVDEQTFSNFFTIQTRVNIAMNFSVTAFNVKHDSFTFQVNITRKLEDKKTMSHTSIVQSGGTTFAEELTKGLTTTSSRSTERSYDQRETITISTTVVALSLGLALVSFYFYRRKRDMSTLIQFTSLRTDNLKEQSIVFQCNASNFPKSLEIIDRCEGVVYTQKDFNPKNYQRVMTDKYEHMFLPQKLPLSLECKVQNYQNKPNSVFLDWKIDNSPPKICSISQKIVRVNVNDTARVYIKVLAYPKIVYFNVTKDTMLGTGEKQWTWYSRNLSEVLWYIEIFKDNIQEEDFGNYTVSIQSQVEQQIKIDFSVLLKDNATFLKLPINDICENGSSSSTVYRLVKSGLPLSFTSDTLRFHDKYMMSNTESREYLFTLSGKNCTDEPFNLQAGSTKLQDSFNFKKKNLTLESCDSTDHNTNMYVLIGHTVELEMCVISQTLINESNIGWNNTPYLKITDKEKLTVNITKDGDHNKIKIKISNITRDDIKFYIVTVRNKTLHKIFYIFNLLLKEDAPYFCENNYTVEVNHLSQDNSTIVNFCIRSYPVLSRHILINNKMYRINGTFDGLSIDSTVDEKTFSNFITIRIQTRANIAMNFSVTALNVKNDSFTFQFNIPRTLEQATTTTSVASTLSSNATTPSEEITTANSLNTSRSTETSCNQKEVIIITITVVVILIGLALALFYFFWIVRKRTIIRRRSRSSDNLRYLNQACYNNMQEIKALNVGKDDKLSMYESKYENIVKKPAPHIDAYVDKSQTGLLPGRYRNDEGLLYVTVDFQNKDSKTPQAKNVEGNYVQIDPIKTKEMLHKHKK